MIRDRKMYVAPTPYALTEGTENQITLITPASVKQNDGFKKVGHLTRIEAKKLIIGYEFDLVSNDINANKIDNPNADKPHEFCAYRIFSDNGPEVSFSE